MKLWRIICKKEVFLYLKQKKINQKQADEFVSSVYLLTTDLDFDPVYDGIRKLNVVDWLLLKENSDK